MELSTQREVRSVEALLRPLIKLKPLSRHQLFFSSFFQCLTEATKITRTWNLFGCRPQFFTDSPWRLEVEIPKKSNPFYILLFIVPWPNPVCRSGQYFISCHRIQQNKAVQRLRRRRPSSSFSSVPLWLFSLGFPVLRLFPLTKQPLLLWQFAFIK